MARCDSQARGHAKGRLQAIVLGLLVFGSFSQALASTYVYVDWTHADVARGTAEGTITLPDGSTVTVDFEAINPDGTPGNLYGAQVDVGRNYWNPASPYISEDVENAPSDRDILKLAGGQNQTYRVTLSAVIKDPIMAIVSLGAPRQPTSCDFDAPFEIVSQGAGYFGGSENALVPLPDDVLHGTEGHGTIRFLGQFSTISWTVPTFEPWHGFTFAIRTTERLEPSPPDNGGCACRLGGHARSSPGGASILLFATVLAVRWRRRSRSGTR